MGTMAKVARGEQTKSTIIDAALGLFEEVGYDATTMRAIAKRAGVSVGNAYYYFDSKDQLVQGFYDRAAERHLEVSRARLDDVTDLAGRIYGHLECWFEIMGGYHEFAAAFFRTAADPNSPMSPFSNQSEPARAAAIARWRDVVEGATDDVPDHVRDQLPAMLWLLHMGIILFWVHDRSAGQIATRLAIGAFVPIVVRAIKLSDVPELRELIDDLMRLADTARDASA